MRSIAYIICCFLWVLTVVINSPRSAAIMWV